MKIEYHKVFEHDFTDQVKFGSLSTNLLYDLFKDGRVASRFLEEHIPILFPELEFVNKSGYDHIRPSDNRKFEQKCFTKYGCKYPPSNMVGKGRKIDIPKLHESANSIDYVLIDIFNFPIVKMVFVPGTFLVSNYPKGSIPLKDRKKIFHET